MSRNLSSAAVVYGPLRVKTTHIKTIYSWYKRCPSHHRWSAVIEALPGVLGNRGKMVLFQGTGEQRSNFEGNRGTKTILGNREHKKTNFRFLGNRGTSQFISGEQGNRYPLGGHRNCIIICYLPKDHLCLVSLVL